MFSVKSGAPATAGIPIARVPPQPSQARYHTVSLIQPVSEFHTFNKALIIVQFTVYERSTSEKSVSATARRNGLIQCPNISSTAYFRE